MNFSHLIQKIKDPKSFIFQFSATFLILLVVSELNGSVECVTKVMGKLIILICATWKITKLIRKYGFHTTITSDNKAVLITGCDSGFGHLLANRLNRQGFTVYATCMDPNGDGPQNLIKMAANPESIKLITMNVTSDTDIAQAYEEVSKCLRKDRQSLWAIVNNAGVTNVALVECGNLEDYQKVFDINVIGTVRVTRTFLPLIRKSKGRIVNMASIAGRIAGPGRAIYSMSKHAVVAFSASLRREMLPWGVKVSTVEPARYKTPMTNDETLFGAAKDRWKESPDHIRSEYGQDYFDSTLPYMVGETPRDDPNEVINAICDAITAQDSEVAYRVCGLYYSIVWFFNDYLPDSIFDFFVTINVMKIKPKAA